MDSFQARLRELLAEQEHATWASWMQYVFDLYMHSDGSVHIPAGHANEWLRQVATPYAGLSDREKTSDLAEVDKILPAIVDLVEPMLVEEHRKGYAAGQKHGHNKALANQTK